MVLGSGSDVDIQRQDFVLEKEHSLKLYEAVNARVKK